MEFGTGETALYRPGKEISEKDETAATAGRGVTMDRVIIEYLPEIRNSPAKRWVDEKGEFVQISWGTHRSPGFFERKGQFRGGHSRAQRRGLLCRRGTIIALPTLTAGETCLLERA